MFRTSPSGIELRDGRRSASTPKYVGLTLHSDHNFSQSPFSSNLSGSVASTANANPRTTAAAPAANAIDAVSFITTYGNTTAGASPELRSPVEPSPDRPLSESEVARLPARERAAFQRGW